MANPNNAATDPRAAAQQDEVKRNHDALEAQKERVDASVPHGGREAATDRDAAAVQDQVRRDHDRLEQSARRVESSVNRDSEDPEARRKVDEAHRNAEAARDSANRNR